MTRTPFMTEENADSDANNYLYGECSGSQSCNIVPHVHSVQYHGRTYETPIDLQIFSLVILPQL